MSLATRTVERGYHDDPFTRSNVSTLLPPTRLSEVQCVRSVRASRSQLARHTAPPEDRLLACAASYYAAQSEQPRGIGILFRLTHLNCTHTGYLLRTASSGPLERLVRRTVTRPRPRWRSSRRSAGRAGRARLGARLVAPAPKCMPTPRAMCRPLGPDATCSRRATLAKE